MIINAKISLRAARVNTGLTQAQAADKLLIGTSTLHGYESGKRQPRMDLLSRMEALYGIGMQHFRDAGPQSR
ncbi:MAG: helix-turn-helix transcriptional regulator [Oscillospiraceae bacterium]|nr:helix-turn-helix transcriptional regulator [Oscillospiraceae bacterium]